MSSEKGFKIKISKISLMYSVNCTNVSRLNYKKILFIYRGSSKKGSKVNCQELINVQGDF